jgi:thiol-disulfide isomerase/thioredoxin
MSRQVVIKPGRVAEGRRHRVSPSPSRRHVVALSLSWLILPLAASGRATAKPPDEVGTGQLLREATLRGLNGRSRALSTFRGQPLIINVWASWCGPCRQEMASLERLAWQQHAAPFTIIGISTDDDPAKAKQWLDTSHATINHFIDSDLLWESMLGASRLPLTVLVDADGRVVDKVYGAKQWDGRDAMALISNAFRQRVPSRAR